jgi:hypothetical protein
VPHLNIVLNHDNHGTYQDILFPTKCNSTNVFLVFRYLWASTMFAIKLSSNSFCVCSSVSQCKPYGYCPLSLCPQYRAFSQRNHSPLEWRVPLVGGCWFWFCHNTFLAHAAAIAVTDYVVYSADEGRWTRAQIYGGEYCAPGAFLIYRPLHTADEECPSISFLVQELHQRMMLALPQTPPPQVPPRYMHGLPVGSALGCSSLVPDSDSDSG